MSSRSWAHGALAVGLSLTLAACAGGAGGGQTARGWADSLSQQDVAALGGQGAVEDLKKLYKKALSAGERQVVIYAPTPKSNKPLYDRFTERFPGIEIQGVPAFGAELLTKVNNEFASGQRIADLTATGSTTTVQLHHQGRYATYRPSTARDLVPHCVGPQEAFFCTSITPFGIIYNSEKVPHARAPQSWKDLLDPRWKGKTAIWADPSTSGPSGGLMTQLLYDERYTEDFVRRLATQNVAVSSGTIPSKIATGQHLVGFPVPSTIYHEAKSNGAPLDFVFPVRGGNYLVYVYAGLLKGAPHPNAAKLFLNYVHTPEAAAIYVQRLGDYASAAGSPGPGDLPPLAEVDDLANIPLNKNRKVYNETLEVIGNIWN